MVFTKLLGAIKSVIWIKERSPSVSDVKERYDEFRNPFPDEIQGCIDHDGVLWRFRTTVDVENRLVEDVDLRFNPICPDCRAELDSETKDLIGIGRAVSPYASRSDRRRQNALRNRPFWNCSVCDFRESRQKSVRQDVRKRARRHSERIVESRDEPYSLPSLVSELEEVDARSVWKAYESVVDDDEVSTQCFH